MFSFRTFWKIYLGFALFIVLTVAVVGNFVTYQNHGFGIAEICAGFLLVLLCGLFFARRTAEEILRREQAETALGKSRQFENLFKHANDAILIFEPENETVLNVNDKACEMYGLSREEFIGCSLKERSQNSARGSEELEKLLHDGVYEEFESNHLRGDGTPLDLVINASVIEYENRPAILTINRDVRQRKQMETALREREQHLLSVTNSAKDAIVSADNCGNIIFWNEGARKIFGYDEPEIVGKPLSILMPEKYREAHAKGMRRHLETGEKRVIGQTVELHGLRKDGTEFPLELSLGVWETDDGKYFTGIMRDITERKQAEDALRRNEANLKAAQRIAHLGSWEVELSDTKRIKESKVRWSDEVYRIFGYKPGKFEVSFDHFFDAVHPLDRKRVRRAFLKAVSHRQDLDISYRIVLLNGEERFQYGQGKVIYDEQTNKPLKFVGTVQDITERKQAETELFKLAAIVEFSNDAIFSKNLDGIITSWNNGAEQLFGYRPDEIINRHISILFPPKRLDEETEIIENITKGESVKNFETVRVSKNGTHIPVSLTISPIKNSEGEIVGVSKVAHDITERKRAVEKLRDSRQWLKAILDGSRDGILIEDNSEIIYVNDAYSRLLGYDAPEDLIGKNVAEILPPDEAERLSEFGRRRLRGEKVPSIYEFKGKCKDGTLVEVEGTVSTSVIGGKKYIMTAIRDITERKRVREELQESEMRYRLLFENNPNPIWVYDVETFEFLAVNEEAVNHYGYSREEYSKMTIKDVRLPEDVPLLLNYIEQIDSGVDKFPSVRHQKKDGSIIYADIAAQHINFNGRRARFALISDITERKRIEEKLQHDAFHDDLTGLANRALFMDHLQRTIERGKNRHSNFYAVLFLDFDRFKIINDSLGHSAGDNFLKLVAKRLEHSTRTGDVVARFGGDEFVILLSEMPETDDAIQIAERIQEDLKKPFDLGGREIFASASIGVTYSTAGHTRAEDMLRDADIAMYDAKAKGRARYRVFDKAMHNRATKRLQIETEMRLALERKEFCAHYQPIIDIETNNLMGFESLIRWQHPERGMIPPFDFIPVAEENNLILPIGNWILRESCRQLREWQTTHPAAENLTVSVNLSSKEFLQTDLAEQIAETLRSTGLKPQCLKLEITESHLMDNSESAIEILNRLRLLGVRLSLDDFGTGYSSLSYLHRLPVSFLKIDRSFVMRMTDCVENEEIVHTIIKLAQNLKMKTIAEGIETAEQLARLKRLKCEYGQGYFFSKPLVAGEAEAFIEDFRANSAPPIDERILSSELNM